MLALRTGPFHQQPLKKQYCQYAVVIIISSIHPQSLAIHRSDQGLNHLIKLAIIDLGQQFLEVVCIVEVSGKCREGLESVARMVIGHSSILHGQFTQHPCLLGDVVFGQHADVGTYSKGLLPRDCIAVEGATVPEDEVSCQGVDLHAVGEGLLLLIILRHQVPVLLEVQHALILKVLPMMEMRPWHHYESALILLRVSQVEDSLVAPDVVAGRGLVAMEEGVDLGRLVVASAVHEAEPIKRTLQLFSIPQSLEKRHGSLSQFPLCPRVPHVLDHASMQDRRVIFGQDLCFRVCPVKTAISQDLHDGPEFLDVFGTVFR